MTAVVRYVFEEDGKFYPQFFQINVCVSYKCQNMIELIFPKELILIKQMHQKKLKFVIIGNFQVKTFIMNHIFATAVMI